jgi:hypothetical protein
MSTQHMALQSKTRELADKLNLDAFPEQIY